MGKPGCQARYRAAFLRKADGAAAFDITRPGHQVGLAAFQLGQHLRQNLFVMLQVGVYHRDKGRGRRQHAFDAGAGKATPPDPADTAHPQVCCADGLYGIGSAVGRIVIDENGFPRDSRQRQIQPAHQFGDIAPLFIGGNDNGELGAAQPEGTP